MSMWNKNREKLLLAGILFLMLFFGLQVQAHASWVMNEDGSYSYTNSKGVVVTDSWIMKKYYVDSEGKRLTGKHQIGENWYYFSEKNGKLMKKRWVRIDGRFYYFDEDGVMQRNKWLFDYSYFVSPKGYRIVNQWKDGRYLGKKGKAYSGLHKIGEDYYYFDTKTKVRVVNTTVTVKGKRWQFDSEGKGSRSKLQTPSAGVSVQSQYYTDPVLDDETLLSYLIYCEAGNQPYAGMVAVGCVVMNRVYSKKMRVSTVREAVYESGQFSPVWNGSLARVLKNPSLVGESCKKAAKFVIKKRARFAAGKTINLKVNGQKIAFPYLHFNAGYPLGNSSYCVIGDHIFSGNWK